MEVGLKGLFRNEKFQKGWMIGSAVVIIILIGCVIYLRSINAKAINNRPPEVKNGQISDEDISLMMADAEESMNSVYMSLIAGSRAVFSDGNVMTFSKNGEFSGYFNADNPNVSGYTYRITSSANPKYQGCLNIFNRNDASYVKYYIVVTSDSSDIKLFNPSDNTYITLEY